MDFNKELALKDLLCVKDIFDKLGVQFFLFQGTCLGAYRNKDFIEYDTDIDIGIFGEESRDIIRKMMVEQGFLMNLEATRAITAKKNVTFNITFFIKEGNEFVSYAIDKCLTPLWCFPSRFGKLKEIEFKNNRFLVPSPTEEYLRWTYGRNWRKPIKGKPAEDYWSVHPKRVAKLLVESFSEFNVSAHPKVKRAVEKLLKQ